MHKFFKQNHNYKPYVFDTQYFISKVNSIAAWALGRIGLWFESVWIGLLAYGLSPYGSA